jgi:predicted transglutaminase-like cysteine proteinase
MISSESLRLLILFDLPISAEFQNVATRFSPTDMGGDNMRKISTLAAVAAAMMFAGLQYANAGLLGTPMGLQSAIQHIKFETTTLAPMACTQFCLRCEDECRTIIMFRGNPIQSIAERWDDLNEVNKAVNEDIIPERNELGLAGGT